MKMTIEVNETWHIAVVNVSGTVDQDAFQSIKDKTLELIKNGIKNILLDFSDVDFMCCVKLKAINEISERLEVHPEAPLSKVYHLRVLHPQNTTRSIKISSNFDTYNDEMEAINAF